MWKKEFLKFGDVRTEKKVLFYQECYPYRRCKYYNIVIIEKLACQQNGLKWFFGSENNEEVKPMCILLLKLSLHLKIFDDATTVFFLVKYEKFGILKHQNRTLQQQKNHKF